MEENNVKVKNKAKITVVLIVFLLLGAAVGAAFLLLPKKKVTENQEVIIKYEEEETAADEATLRELLAHDSNMIIEVTEDIMLNQPLNVNGGKKLTGDGTIAMELYVQPYQYMFVVSEDSKLELDGATIDGNASSNCVKVEKNAQFSLLSGKMTYGCPYVIESFGNVYIKGGSIVDAVGTGVYAHGGANVYMTAGSVRGCIDCGIEGAVQSYISISEKAVLHDNMEYFIYSKGLCDITGGEFRDAQLDMVYSAGVMNVKYEGKEKDGMLEWHDIQGCAFILGSGGELNVEGLHVTDVGNRIISTAKGQSIAKMNNCLFENTGGDAVYVRTEVQLNNVEIKNAGISGIRVIETGKANVENVTVTGTTKDGIQCSGGVVTGSDFTVNSAGRIGVNAYKYNDVAATVKLKNVTVNGAKSNGLHVETSTLSATDVKIKDVGGEGARAQLEGKLNITNIEVENAGARSIASADEGSKVVVKNLKSVGGKRGIGAFGGDVVATNISVDSPTEYGVTASKKSNMKITDLTIKNAAGTAVNANDAVITIDKVTIDEQKEAAGLNADYGGKITLKNGNIKFAAKAKGDIDGVRAQGPASIKLENVNIANAPRHAIYSGGSEAKVVANNVTTTACKRGIQILRGGQVEGNNVTIGSMEEYGVSCGDEGSGFNLKKLTITECGTTAVNIYDAAIGKASDVAIVKPGTHAGYIGNKAKLTLNNLTASAVTNVGMLNDNATLSITDGTMKNVGAQGIYTSNAGQTTLTNVTISDGARGVQILHGGQVEGEGVTIELPKEYGVTCGGEGSSFNLKKLTITESGTTGVNVYDAAIGTASDVVIVKPGTHAGFIGNKATLTLNELTVSEVTNVGMLNDNATLNITGGSMKGVGAQGIYTSTTGQTTLTDFSIEDSKTQSIRVRDAGSKCVLNDVSTSGGECGIQLYAGGVAEGDSVTITSPKVNGISCSDDGSMFDITELNVSNSGDHGISLLSKATGTMTGGTIKESGKKGIYLNDHASIELSDVAILNSTNENLYLHNASNAIIEGTLALAGGNTYSLAVYGGSKVDKDFYSEITIDNPKNIGIILADAGTLLKVDDVSLTKCQHRGISIQGGAQATFDGDVNIKVQNTGADCLYVTGASSQAVVNGSLATTGGRYGIGVFSGGQVIQGEDYSGITIHSSGSHGVAVMNNSEFNVGKIALDNCGGGGIYMQYDSPTVTLTGQVDLSSIAGNGIEIYAGNLVAGTATIHVTTANYGLRARGGVTNIGALNVDGAKAYSSIYIQGDTTNVTINGGTIKNSKQHGINVKDKATLNLTNYTIQNIGLNGGNTTYYAIQNEGGNATINLENVTPNSIHKM